MSDFFERLEHELRGAVTRAAPSSAAPAQDRSSRHRRLRSSVGAVMVAFASVAAIAVVVIVVALTGHGRHVRASSPPRPTASACTSRLLAAVAVLRRPQTRADRAFNPDGNTITGLSQSKPFPYVVVPGLTRRARTLPDGRSVFFVVYRPVGDTRVTQLGDFLQAFVPSPGGRSAAFVTEVMPPLLSYAYQEPPTKIAGIYLGLVPNGVARVRWTFPREAIPQVKVPGEPVLRAHVIPGAEITANVQGNVAAAKDPNKAVFLPSRATWLAADGQVIKTVKYFVPSPRHAVPTSTVGSETAPMRAVPVPATC
jgi:hypothetical protein